ncbi:hypothetical protein LguiA_027021 [Lonicera macranthoides]
MRLSHPTHGLFLLAFFAFICFLASFTDNFKSVDGQMFYGFATLKRMRFFDYWTTTTMGIPDLSKYKIGFVDWIHAIFSAFVLVALRDNKCGELLLSQANTGCKKGSWI